MPKKTFQVQLSIAERARLQALISQGSATAHTHIHARILLKADEGLDGPAWTDAMISAALDVGMSTVARVRQAAVQEGLDAALQRKVPARVYTRTLDGAGEAHLVAIHVVCEQLDAALLQEQELQERDGQEQDLRGRELHDEVPA